MVRPVLLVFLVALCGCATIHKSVDVSVGDAAKDPFDGRHYYAVLDALGPPSQISKLPEGFVFLYDSLAEVERQLGISFGQITLGQAFDVNLLKISFGRATLKPEYFVVIFDRQGIARTSGLYAGQKKIGGSFTLQLVVTVKPTTDMSYLDLPPVQQDWGLSMLRQPPVALNASGDFGSGEAGVEVRGAPTAVGQHSLEMPPGKTRKQK